jgi:predicted molibdopterin-dependent oxidoreductase YjgC
MLIKINDTEVGVDEGTVLLEAARSAGFYIPSLCYGQEAGAAHRPSCMVCAVKNSATGEIVPACSVTVAEGMRIETDSEDVQLVRRLSLELLLSDHRADCDAPCGAVCPHGLDIERMLAYWDEGRNTEARAVVADAFALPETGCEGCKVPCEKVCRRKMTSGAAVDIRGIIRELAAMDRQAMVDKKNVETPNVAGTPESGKRGKEKEMYRSLPGILAPDEARRIRESITSVSGCLHCACSGRGKCKLRVYATAEGIKRSRYNLSSTLPVMHRENINGRLWFEPSKCIRCGLCVYNTPDGFTFSGRGFSMLVIVPEESRAGIGEELSELCPTGALYIK